MPEAPLLNLNQVIAFGRLLSDAVDEPEFFVGWHPQVAQDFHSFRRSRESTHFIPLGYWYEAVRHGRREDLAAIRPLIGENFARTPDPEQLYNDSLKLLYILQEYGYIEVYKGEMKGGVGGASVTEWAFVITEEMRDKLTSVLRGEQPIRREVTSNNPPIKYLS